MAHSLEAVLVVPISIVVITSTLGMAVPTYITAETTSYLSAEASKQTSVHNSIYRGIIVEHNDSYISAVSVCPDGLIDLCRLGNDLIRPIGTITDGEDTYE